MSPTELWVQIATVIIAALGLLLSLFNLFLIALSVQLTHLYERLPSWLISYVTAYGEEASKPQHKDGYR